MKHTVNNIQHLRNIFLEIKSLIDKNKIINISFEEVKRLKTKKQLGYLFGGILKSIQQWYFDNTGEKESLEDIKYAFYKAILPVRKKEVFGKDSTFFCERYFGLSQMTIEQASKFINDVLDLIDYSELFDGFILPPHLRYCWLNNISKEELVILSGKKFNPEQKEYLSYLRTLSCISCGSRDNVQSHHVRLGNESGAAQKPSDILTIPLCHYCHNKLHSEEGELDFYKGLKNVIGDFNINTFCKLCFNRWYLKK